MSWRMLIAAACFHAAAVLQVIWWTRSEEWRYEQGAGLAVFGMLLAVSVVVAGAAAGSWQRGKADLDSRRWLWRAGTYWTLVLGLWYAGGFFNDLVGQQPEVRFPSMLYGFAGLGLLIHVEPQPDAGQREIERQRYVRRPRTPDVSNIGDAEKVKPADVNEDVRKAIETHEQREEA